MEALEPFYPDRMAKRILGMGDVLSLVEKAQGAIDVWPPEVYSNSMFQQILA